MKDYVEIGCSPSDEGCVQVGTDNYAVRARRECNVFRDQLRRTFGPEPEGARIVVKSNPHDFGSYYDVICQFDDEYPASVEYAFKLEAECPEKWDADAAEALAMADINP